MDALTDDEWALFRAVWDDASEHYATEEETFALHARMAPIRDKVQRLVDAVLVRDNVLEHDFTMTSEQGDDDVGLDGVWITVVSPDGKDRLSVNVHRNGEGVTVDVWPLGGELEEPLASTYAYWKEGDE